MVTVTLITSLVLLSGLVATGATGYNYSIADQPAERRQLQIALGCSVDYSRGPSRAQFPKTFLFGAATSAYQVEGAVSQGKRGLTIWDVFAKTPGKIVDGSNGDIACDHYNKYPEDIRLMKNMYMNAYRFSIAWSRIIPTGSGHVNKEGIAHYNAVINALIATGIRPVVTLYHWDLPLALHQKYNGWLSRRIIKHFAQYADICFANFGDRVKTWITINEPQQVAVQGYGIGTMAPGRCTDRSKCSAGDGSTEPYTVGHHLLLAHAEAVFVYRRKYKAKQGGRIGITLDMSMIYPLTNSPDDVAAAQRQMEFSFGWYARPIVSGYYPPVMRQYVGSRLPIFNRWDRAAVLNSVDFFGLNFYTASMASKGYPPSHADSNPWSDSQVSTTGTVNGKLIGEQTVAGWLLVVPRGMHDVVMWVKNNYAQNLPIIITENGCADGGSDRNSLICDTQRTRFYQDYLTYLAQAIKEGANVQGYFAWSLLDNFEWAQGYTQRFGLHYVDFTTPARTRTAKASAIWWSRFMRSLN